MRLARRRMPSGSLDFTRSGPAWGSRPSSLATLIVGAEAQVHACVQLGSILPQDVAVELYLGRLNPAGDFVEAVVTPMKPVDRGARGNFSFEAITACPRSGMHGFTVRIRPAHPDLSAPFLPGLICWADAARIGT